MSFEKLYQMLYSTWSKIHLFVILSLVLASVQGFAVEIVCPGEKARRYLDADLVIIGDVVSCTTKTIQEKDSLGDSGWVYHHTTLMDIYGVKVDSVLKGSFTDSVIVVQSKPFGGDFRKSKFLEVDEKGDSLFVTWLTQGFGGGGADRIHKPGRYIILLQGQDTIYTSTLCRQYSKFTVDLEIEEKGKEYFKKP